MNDFKLFLKKLLDYVCVKKCVACDELLEFDYNGFLCPKCEKEWDEAKRTVCDRCFNMHSKCRCSFGKQHVDGMRHLALYDHNDREWVVNKIVYSLKKSNADDVFEFVAREMADNLIDKNTLNNAVFVGIPRTPKSVRKYGYDHAKKLAKKLAEILDGEYVDALGHRGGDAEQKTLNKAQRALNAKNNCFIKDKAIPKIKGKTVFLVDDIGTTGAMTGACAEILHNNGANKVLCLLAAKNKLQKKK